MARTFAIIAGLFLLALTTCNTALANSADAGAASLNAQATLMNSAANFAAPVQVPVVIGEGDRALRGTLTLPQTEGLVACVVLVHGCGAHDQDYSVGPNKPYMQLANGLAARGIAVLRYDKRTYAYPDSVNNPNFDINEESLMDACDAVDFARSQTRIDSQRVFFCGHSMGGLLAPEMAKRVPELAGVVLLSSPGRTLEQIVAEMDSKGQTAALSQLTPRCWQQVKDIDAPSQVLQLEMPVFVAQGGADSIVPINNGYSPWQKALSNQNSNVSLALYPMNHALLELPNESSSLTYASRVPNQLVDDLSGWINNATRQIALN